MSRQIQKLHLDNDEQQSLRHGEDLDRKRQFVLSKLDPPDYEYDLERASSERADSASGNWLLNEPEFQQWSDMTTIEGTALYLNGIPGTGWWAQWISVAHIPMDSISLTSVSSGKTILASRVVSHLQRESIHDGNRMFSVLYFFFKHHQPEKQTFVALLLSLLAQLVLLDEVVLDLLYQRLKDSSQQKVRSVAQLRELADLALKTQRLCFVVVDGLDECVDPSTQPEHAQREVIDRLEAFVTIQDSDLGDETSGSEPDDRGIRLLISGQRNGYLEDRLRHWPSIQVDAARAHMSDIETYSKTKSVELRQRFGIDEATRLDIANKVNSTAIGRFRSPHVSSEC